MEQFAFNRFNTFTINNKAPFEKYLLVSLLIKL